MRALMLFALLLPLWSTADRYPWFPGLKSGAGETKSACADWTHQVNQPDAGQSGNNKEKSISTPCEAASANCPPPWTSLMRKNGEVAARVTIPDGVFARYCDSAHSVPTPMLSLNGGAICIMQLPLLSFMILFAND
jgi:hypothetical protein